MPQFGIGGLIGGNRFNQSLSNAMIVPAGQQAGTTTSNIAAFAPPPAFTPGNAGCNILTGPAAYFSQIPVKKNLRFRERWSLLVHCDFQNPFHNFAFNPPSHLVDFKTPQLFGKFTSDRATASVQGEPLMNLVLSLSWWGLTASTRHITRPRRTALSTSSAVLCRSSFSMMRQRCVSTVCKLRPRRLAISLLLLPSPNS